MSTAATTAPLGGHLVHVILFSAWIPIFAGLVLRDRAKARRLDPGPQGAPLNTCASQRYIQMMAVACVCAALIHTAVMPDHFKESVLYGGFFLATALGQLALAFFLLSRPSRALTKAGIAASGLVVVLWLASRLVGVPVGPDNGATESFGQLDVVASAFEVLTVIAGALSLRSWLQTPTWRLRMWTGAMRAAATLCVAGTIALSIISPRS